MFIGHYGPAVWDAHRADGVRLWHGFLAVQAVDIVTMLLTIAGIEGQTPPDTHPLAFDIPYSHSLVGSLLISVAAALLYRVLRPKAGTKGMVVIGGLAFSHWVLDLIVHRPDMPIWPGGDTLLGLGLWNYAWPAYGLEVLLLGGMFAWWLSVTRGPLWTAVASWVLVTAMSVIQFFVMTKPTLELQQTGTLPPQPDGVGPSVAGLVIFFVFAGVVALIERGREPKTR